MTDLRAKHIDRTLIVTVDDLDLIRAALKSYMLSIINGRETVQAKAEAVFEIKAVEEKLDQAEIFF